MFVRMIIMISYVFLGVVDDFMWDVWFGKYSYLTKHRWLVFLSPIIIAIYGASPFFVVSPTFCIECTNTHVSEWNIGKKYCHIKCTACDNTYVKCLIPGCNRLYQNNQECTVFKRRSVKAYMNDHMKRFHNVTLGNHDDCSKPVVVVAKNIRAPTVSQHLMDEALPEQADEGCLEFECTESSIDMEGIVQSSPCKGESSDSKCTEAASGMEYVVRNEGNDESDHYDIENNDETSFQRSVDSAFQDHRVVPDCSQHYVPEIIQISLENTIQEENEDFNSVEYLQFATHRGMNLNPNLDMDAVSVAGLTKPDINVTLPRESRLEYRFRDFDFLDFRTENAKKLVRKNSCVEAYSQTQLYFYQKYIVKAIESVDSGGYQGLVHRANVANKEDASGLSDRNETQLAYMMQKILIGIKGDLKDVFMQFQSKMRDMVNTEKTSCTTKTKFPRTGTDARRFFTDGTHSILKNFPVQEVFEVNNHACVSLKETILLAAGHCGGFDFAWDGRLGMKGPSDGLNRTRAVADLITDIEDAMREAIRKKEPNRPEQDIDRDIKATSKGYIYFWSDSFLRCFVKQKDNSVWILTVTISPRWADVNKGTYTHVLAMGKSSDDHTPVIDNYMREARELQRGFRCYFGDTNDIRYVAFGLLLHSADRPERQALGHTRKEGYYGKITNYAHCVSTRLFPACLDCYRDQLSIILGEKSAQRNCQKCQAWAINPEVQDSPVPKKYPAAQECNVAVKPPKGREPGLKKIGPIKLSREFLIQACSFAYEMRREGKWLKDEFMDYLRTCNVNDVILKRISDLVDQDKSNNTRTDIREVLPAVWLEYDCFNRHRLPDLPMHGVSHGMICDMIDFFHGVLAKWKKMSSFDQFANKTINDVAVFQLSWCKLKRLPKAAWVSENTNAFMRLFSYLYGMYFLNHPVDEDKQVHRINMSRMMNASQACISMLMSRGDIEGSEVEKYMKFLMSTAHYLHKEFGSIGEKDDPDNNERVGATKQRSRKRKRNSTDIVDQLSHHDVLMLLETIEANPTHKCTVKKEQLRKISTATLKSVLKKLNEKVSGDKNVLWLRLFSKILDRSLEAEYQECDSQKQCSITNDSNSGNFVIPSNANGESDVIGNEETHSNGLDNFGERIDVDMFESKRETYIWNKGAWLSFCVNIKSQWDYLGNAIMIYEAREENSIRSPKAILYGMQKNQEYREYKLRLLHKLNGFDTLMYAFPEIHTRESVSRYKGYHVFESSEYIKQRHKAGKPLSCFTLDGEIDTVCVAFHGGYIIDDDGDDVVHYLTFKYKTGGIMDDKVSGVHYCGFQEGTEMTIKKEELSTRIDDYALMLPLIAIGKRFVKQFTLVYSDWRVLRTDNQENNKGIPCIDRGLFGDLLGEQGIRIDKIF